MGTSPSSYIQVPPGHGTNKRRGNGAVDGKCQSMTFGLIRFYSGCHSIKLSLLSNRNLASAAGDLVPTSKIPLPFTNCFWSH